MKRDRRTEKVLGFFVAKGLLRGGRYRFVPNAKLRISDVLWVADHVEPRVLEVFPAAYLHFPRTFFGRGDIPEELGRIIEGIGRRAAAEGEYRGIRVRDMARWANRILPDRRTKPLSEIRRNKTLRLRPDVLERLASLARERRRSQTRLVEELIMGAPILA